MCVCVCVCVCVAVGVGVGVDGCVCNDVCMQSYAVKT